MDYIAARANMIESQVRTNDVSDLALQAAMRKVAREAFVVQDKRAFAYAEVASPTPSGRDLWKPRDFSKLAQAAKVLPGETVLVIGGAGGYSAAVLSAMGCAVTILDSVACDVPGVTTLVGDLSSPPQGPFNIIFVDGGVEVVPESWTEALGDGGRLCVVIVSGVTGRAQVIKKSGNVASPRVVFDAIVPELPGFRAEAVFSF
jgi:protein-L-isoaspartate(D-aspartate) O-methyltransferase